MSAKITSRRAAVPARSGVFRHSMLSLAITCCFAGSAAQSQPFGPQVVSGQANFATQGNSLIVNNSPNAIINWQGFSIGANELTRFNQQSAASAVLNRVIGIDNSAILGALQSNGKVYLINPNGIFIGPNARIDVAGLIASTLDLTNQDFLAGRYQFNAGPMAGKLTNQGRITTPEGGQIYLLAPNIENSGILTSPKGDVTLAAGHSVQLVDSANPHLQVVVSAPADQALNLGEIVAQAGRIGIYGALVSHKGKLSADSAVIGENGKIILKASRDALVEGSISAQGAGQGGEIQVLGDRVGILDGARLDASGQNGGGTILVGGDYQGKNPAVTSARQTFVSKGAELRADAGIRGDGGKIVVWSLDNTAVHGTLSALSAPGWKGGLVETSGHALDVAGIKVRVGEGGTWLLDPTDITVDGPTAASLKDTLDGGGDVSLSSSSPGGNINVNAAIEKATGGDANLTFNAHNDINVNASISSSNGKLNITLNADSAGTGTGTVSVGGSATVKSNGGNVSISAGNLALSSSAAFALDAGGGDMTIATTANNSIALGATATATLEKAGMDISGVELQSMRASTLTLKSGNAGTGTERIIYVDGISATNSANLGKVVLDAHNDPHIANSNPSVQFNNNPSTFNALDVKADAGIYIHTGIATTSGDLTLTSNQNGIGEYYDAISMLGGVTLTAAGKITTNGQVWVGHDYLGWSSGNVTLNGNGIILNGQWHHGGSNNTASFNAGTGALTINADVNASSNTLSISGQSVTQSSGAISAQEVNLSNLAGSASLTGASNNISKVYGTVGGNLDLSTASDLMLGKTFGQPPVVTGLTVSGTATVNAYSVAQAGPVTANTLNATTSANPMDSYGRIWLTHSANQIDNVSLNQQHTGGANIEFNNGKSYTVQSINNATNSGSNGWVALSASAGYDIAIAGPITVAASTTQSNAVISLAPSGGNISCAGSCLLTTNRVHLDTNGGDVGTTAHPLKTTALPSGTLALHVGMGGYLGSASSNPTGEIHVSHTGNLSLYQDYAAALNKMIDVSASGNLTVPGSQTIQTGTAGLVLGSGGQLNLEGGSTIRGNSIEFAVGSVNINHG